MRIFNFPFFILVTLPAVCLAENSLDKDLESLLKDAQKIEAKASKQSFEDLKITNEGSESKNSDIEALLKSAALDEKEMSKIAGSYLKEGKRCAAKRLVRPGKELAHEPDEKLFIFVSVSLGTESLRKYSEEAKLYGARLILRGLIKNDIKETHRVMRELGIDVDINPNLFELYNVSVAPTILLRESNQDDCSYDQIEGHVSIKHALERIRDEGDLSGLAASILNQDTSQERDEQ